MAIFFNAEDVEISFIKGRRELKKWLTLSLKNEGYVLGDVNFIFCSDKYLHQINLKFLNHDTYTDIITFDYNSGKTVNADIFISTERVAENAKKYNVTIEEELKRVMIHGILHLCGFGDKKTNEKKIMTERENYYLKNFNKLLSKSAK